MDRIRRALNRQGGPTPRPPAVHEPTARRVYSELGLPEMFAHAAARGGMAARLVHVEELATEVAGLLRQLGVRHVALAPSPMLRKVRLAEGLSDAGFTVGPNGGDAIVAGCDAAVAETGSLAFRGGVPAGWLPARVRILVLEPKNFVPDLIDFFAAATGDVTLVSGPADVQAFVLH